MASLTEAFNDAICEDNSFIKFILYAIPVFVCASLYISKNTFASYFFMIPTLLFFATLLCNGIANIRANKCVILTFNIFSLIPVFIKLFIAIVPIFCVMSLIGYCIFNFVKLPFDFPNSQLIFNCIVGLILFSVVFTSFLAFSKKLNIADAYNLKIISESSFDVLLNLLFLIPQLAIVNGIIIGSVWYLCFVVNLPIESPLFLFSCSLVIVLNISALASYFAQASYELIKGSDSEYRDKYYLNGSGSFTNNIKK